VSEHRTCPIHGREEWGLNDCRQPRDWWSEVYQGRTVEVAERAGRFSRTGIAIRGWYDEGDRMVRVAVNTAREGDRYEVLDLAGNWEAAR
jgi:hypothetical protein